MPKYHKCYCCNFETDFAKQYQQHVKQEHEGKPVYPSKEYIQKNGLKAQDRFWESLGIDN